MLLKCPSCQADNQPDSRFCSRCATPLPQEAPSDSDGLTRTMIASIDRLERGILFAGRYEIIEEIGRGGMGRVYRAYDRQLKEDVALKLLKPEISFNEKAVERFRNELKFARRIAHPRVCRMYDLGESGLAHYLTMEYVEGEDLKAFIRRSDHLTTAKALDIGRQIAEGLEEAHRLGVVHRDLKPQNVMIDREGKAKIMDFGLARISETEGLTGSGLMLGTPEYMSPEQVDLTDVDGRVDIYALGIILYEMVTGHVPFKGETPLAVALKQKNEKARDVRESNPLVPDTLISVILKCLEKDPGHRYQTAAETSEALLEVERGLSSAVLEISKTSARGSSAHLRPRRIKRAVAVPAALAVLAAAIVAVVSLTGKRNPPVAARHSSIVPALEGAEEESTRAGRALLGMLGSKDPENVKAVEKTLKEMRRYLPESGPSVEAWKQAQEKFERSRAGDPAAAGAPEIGGEMQQLMAVISERESARRARDSMILVKTGLRGWSADNNFLFRLAQFEERNADDAFSKNDYAGSKALYRLLERIYQAVPNGKTAARGVVALRGIVKSLKTEAAVVPEEKIDSWLASSAREIAAEAESFASKGDLENACGAFTRAAFLLQKIRDTG
ncbi:MAG: protein kinase [Acidobacteria bacterium]|nr:protein kinase [Acidobacteriota bacterium]